MRSLLALRSQVGADAEKQAKEAKENLEKAEAAASKKSAQAPASAGKSEENQHNAMVLLGGLGLAGVLLAGVLYAHRRKDAFKEFWDKLMAGRRKKAEDNDDAPSAPVAIASARNIFLDLNEKRGTTILISSHILGELERLTSRYGFIVRGKLVHEISSEEVEASGVDLEDLFIKMAGDEA